MKYGFIAKYRTIWPTRTMCRLLGVSSSGFYDWLGRPVSAHERENAQFLNSIKHSHEASDGTYGSPRIVRDLIDAGFSCSENRVARLMKAVGIKRVTSNAGRQGSSVRQFTPSRRIYWTGSLKRQAQIRNWRPTLPTYGLVRAGCLLLLSWTCTRGVWSAVNATDDDRAVSDGCPANGYLPSRPALRGTA